MEIEKTYQKLLEFTDKGLDLGKAISDNRIEEFENKIGFKLTEEFKFLVKKHNNVSLSGTEIFGFGEEFRGASFETMYYLVIKTYLEFMPLNIIPFCPDGRGNYYCLDLSRTSGETCPILFYQFDYPYTDLNDIETCNETFAEWVNEVMIEWNKELLEEDTDDGLSIWETIKSVFSGKKGSH